MYVLDISEDVASLRVGLPGPTAINAGPEIIGHLINACVEHTLSVVAPYKHPVDHIDDWFRRVYGNTPWQTSDWYLTLEGRVIQPLLMKVSHFFFTIVERHPYRILEVDITPYNGGLNQQVLVTVKATIVYSDNEIVTEQDELTPDVSTDFDVVNSAALTEVDRFKNLGAFASLSNHNPTLFSVPDRSPSFALHWSDEDPAETRREQYHETIGWIKRRLEEKVATHNPWI